MSQTTSIIGNIAVSLGSEPPEIQHIPATVHHRAVAVLHLGDALAVHVKHTPPEARRSLAAIFTELAQWQEEQLADGEVA